MVGRVGLGRQDACGTVSKVWKNEVGAPAARLKGECYDTKRSNQGF